MELVAQPTNLLRRRKQPSKAVKKQRRITGSELHLKLARQIARALVTRVLLKAVLFVQPSLARLIKNRCAKQSNDVASDAHDGHRTRASLLAPLEQLFRGRCPLPSSSATLAEFTVRSTRY
jgi:hypothetical protein